MKAKNQTLILVIFFSNYAIAEEENKFNHVEIFDYRKNVHYTEDSGPPPNFSLGKVQYERAKKLLPSHTEIHVPTPFEKGTYLCSNCNEYQFNTDSQIGMGNAWYNFRESSGNLKEITKYQNFYVNKTPVRCLNCSEHVGFIFRYRMDYDKQRYCVSKEAVTFVPAIEKQVIDLESCDEISN